jgi:hypothetical protein
LLLWQQSNTAWQISTGTPEWWSGISTYQMDGVESGSIYEFLSSAAENGWELCAAFPSGHKGSKRAVPGKAEPVECEDATEVISFIFKHSV